MKILIPFLFHTCRKKFVRRQKILHTYGGNEEDVDLDDDVVLAEVQKRLQEKSNPPKFTKAVNPPEGARVNVGGRACRCGNKDHLRTSHRSCPLNKKNKSKE